MANDDTFRGHFHSPLPAAELASTNLRWLNDLIHHYEGTSDVYLVFSELRRCLEQMHQAVGDSMAHLKREYGAGHLVADHGDDVAAHIEAAGTAAIEARALLL